MSKHTNIWQKIRKYLTGELDTRAMHWLERRSQADPFLRDALDGYELKGINHDKNLNELASRLKSRISRKERRIIPLRFITTAATILIFLFAGLLWYINRPLSIQQKTQLAKVKLVPQIKAIPIDTLLNPGKKTEVTILTKKKRHQNVIAPNAAEQNTVMQSEPSADASVAVPTGNSDAKVTEADPIRVPDSLYTKRAAKYGANTLNEVAVGASADKDIITGIVTAKDDDLPIPGVMVTIKGTNIGTQTNTAGKFSLPVPKGATLVFAFVGYSPQVIPVNKKDLEVTLQPASGSLGEVVITNDQELRTARPVNGWSDFKKYLKDHAKSPDRKIGVVKLSFIVNINGSLSDFKIKKSLDTETDNFAIQLIQNGPNWLGNTNNKPKKVTVKVRFQEKQ